MSTHMMSRNVMVIGGNLSEIHFIGPCHGHGCHHFQPVQRNFTALHNSPTSEWRIKLVCIECMQPIAEIGPQTV